jgi:hypothetical protein
MEKRGGEKKFWGGGWEEKNSTWKNFFAIFTLAKCNFSFKYLNNEGTS